MPAAVSILLEQPRNGQQPRNCEKMKLLVRTALRMMAKILVVELMLCRLLFLRCERFFLGFLLLGGLAQRVTA